MTRRTFTSRDVRAGCFTCGGVEPRWFGGQAQGTAALHHDRTRHPTWCDVVMSVRYGEDVADPRQIDIEDSIAAVSSGSAPECAPLPVLDAPEGQDAGVSALTGHSETPGVMPDGARGHKPEPFHA